MNLTKLKFQSPSITFCSFLLLLLPLFTSAQSIDFLSQDADGRVTITIKDLPPLSPVVRSEDAKEAQIPTPHYEYLWVFDDGEFINQSKDATISHIYIGEDGTSRPTTVMAFTTGVYSDDHLDLPPSARAIGGSSGTNNIGLKDSARMEVVTDGLIRLSCNQRGFVAGDKAVFIISLKNPNDFTLAGDLLFFSDPMIEAKVQGESRGEVSYEVLKDEGDNPIPAAFTKTLDLAPLEPDFFLSEVSPQLFPTNLKGRHAKVFRSSFGDLNSQEERHFFVQFDVDENLFDKAPEKEKGALRFTTVVTANQTSGPGGFLNAQDSALIENLSVVELLDSLLANNQPAGRLVADVSTFEGEITRSHDPNYIKAEICECPVDSDGAYKLFCTVHFSNEGTAPTNNIAVSVAFPPAFDILSIPDTLLSIYPQPGAPILPQRDPATNTVRWNLAGFQLFPEAEFGPGNPLTYGEFQFTVLVNPTDAKVDSIPYLQACIEFDGQSPVCTVPVKPVSAESSVAADILKCESCVSAADGGGGDDMPLPWWLLLLLAIILLILIIVAAIRRRLFGRSQ